MTRILVVGRNGQLARALAECGTFAGAEVDFVSRPEIDLLRIDDACASLRERDFDVLVNATAFNDVDGSEADPDTARALNSEAPGRLAGLAADRRALIVHVSTDYVFSGDRGPYREADAPGPLSVYGASKLEGERRVAEANPRHLILRTAWLFSPFGRNFVKTVLRLAPERDELRIVANQLGCPTNALDLAHVILAAVAALRGKDAWFGLYHAAGARRASRFEFAEAIIAASRALGGPACNLTPIPSSEYPTAARRPADSRLDCGRLAASFGLVIPDYRTGLGATVERILSDGTA
jgi:dTDP-4-dehydrorhamnose reductase